MTEPSATRPAGMRGVLVLLVLAVAWLAVMLWSAYASIVNAGDPVIAVIQASIALPVVIGATLLAGAAASLTVLMLVPRLGALTRWLAGTGTGLLVGVLAAALILLGYGHRSSIVVLAVAVFAAGILGGLLGGLPNRAVVAAGLAATVGAFLVDVLLSVFQHQLLHVLGAGSSVSSRVQAASRLALTGSLVAGLVAGIIAYQYLRRTGPGAKLFGYLGAGAVPGLVLLLTEVVTRIGGAQLFGLVGNLGDADRAVLDYLGNSRLDHALVVFFAGAIVALLAFGRTLRPRQPAAARAPRATRAAGTSRPSAAAPRSDAGTPAKSAGRPSTSTAEAPSRPTAAPSPSEPAALAEPAQPAEVRKQPAAKASKHGARKSSASRP